MTRGSISSHSHMSSLGPSHAKLLWGFRRVNMPVGGCQEESELYPSFVLVCICVYKSVCWAPMPVRLHVCLLLKLAVVSVNRSVESVWAVLLCQLLRSPLTHGLLGSLGTQTAAIPSHNSSAKPWTSQEEVWYHESRTSLAIASPRSSSRKFLFPKPGFRPFKSTDSFCSSFHFFLSQGELFCSVFCSLRDWDLSISSIISLWCKETFGWVQNAFWHQVIQDSLKCFHTPHFLHMRRRKQVVRPHCSATRQTTFLFSELILQRHRGSCCILQAQPYKCYISVL